jgi:hypothetical protein
MSPQSSSRGELSGTYPIVLGFRKQNETPMSERNVASLTTVYAGDVYIPFSVDDGHWHRYASGYLEDFPFSQDRIREAHILQPPR